MTAAPEQPAIRVRGLENVDQTKNYIVVSNHQSLLDISLLT